MLIPGNLLRPVLTILILAMVSTGLCATAAAQMSNDRMASLPDPTPRDIPLDKIYAQDPMQKARQQHDALVRNALIRQQIITNVDKMALLAQQMSDDLASANSDGRNSERVSEIEKLAKKIRSLEKER